MLPFDKSDPYSAAYAFYKDICTMLVPKDYLGNALKALQRINYHTYNGHTLQEHMGGQRDSFAPRSLLRKGAAISLSDVPVLKEANIRVLHHAVMSIDDTRFRTAELYDRGEYTMGLLARQGDTYDNELLQQVMVVMSAFEALGDVLVEERKGFEEVISYARQVRSSSSGRTLLLALRGLVHLWNEQKKECLAEMSAAKHYMSDLDPTWNGRVLSILPHSYDKKTIDSQEARHVCVGTYRPLIVRSIERFRGRHPFDLDILSGCTQIMTLDLMGVVLHNVPSLAQHKNLEVLVVDECGLDGDKLVPSEGTFPHLTQFAYGCDVPVFDPHAFMRASNINRLSLSGKAGLDWVWFLTVDDCAGVRELHYAPTSEKSLFPLVKFKSLERLYLDLSDFRGASPVQLDHVGGATLRHVYLHSDKNPDPKRPVPVVVSPLMQDAPDCTITFGRGVSLMVDPYVDLSRCLFEEEAITFLA